MEKIYMTIVEVLKRYINDIGLNDNLKEINLAEHGMDSIVFIHIVVEIEEKFNIEIPDEYLVVNKMDTIDKIINVILQSKCIK